MCKNSISVYFDFRNLNVIAINNTATNTSLTIFIPTISKTVV